MIRRIELNRYTAFATHLATSFLVVSILLATAIVLWYPPPLFQIDGGWKALRLVAAVDLVLGPLLTLVVFRPGKPGLKRDMGVILTVQLLALAWGIWVMYDNRPGLMVYADDVVRPVAVSLVDEVDPEGDVWERFGDDLPLRLAVPIPFDPVAGSEYLMERVRSKTALHLHTRDYVPLRDWWPGVVADSLDVDHYVAARADWQALLEDAVEAVGLPRKDLVFLPVEGRNKSGIIVAELRSMDFVGFLDIPYDPRNTRRRMTVAERVKWGRPTAPPVD